MSRVVALLALVLLPSVAFAQEETATASAAPIESPRNFTLEFRLGRYTPAIDSEPGLVTKPYQTIFGNHGLWLFEAELDYFLFKRFGTAALGFSGGFGTVTGHGLYLYNATPSPDTTSLRTIPLTILATYRFDYLARRFGIPLVPYGKAGLSNTLWWSNRGDGSVARMGNDKAFGGKWGWRAAAGLAFELNFLDPGVGREFDMDFGVNSVFAFAEYAKTSANNFGKPGLDLSGHFWQFGLAFEF